MLNTERVRLARTVASAAHAGQMRKGLPEAYITHPLRVATMAYEAGLPEDAVVAALLHDVVEDTPVTFEVLEAAGFTPRSLELVRLLTKTYGDGATAEVKAREKPLYYARILTDSEATHLKVLDRVDNLTDMVRMLDTPGNEKRVKWAIRYLEKTRSEFPPLVKRMPLSTGLAYEYAVALYEDRLREVR